MDEPYGDEGGARRDDAPHNGDYEDGLRGIRSLHRKTVSYLTGPAETRDSRIGNETPPNDAVLSTTWGRTNHDLISALFFFSTNLLTHR